MKFIRKFLMIVSMGLILMATAHAATNIPMGDIDQYGTWTTPHNREQFTNALTNDMAAFTDGFQKQLVKDYVPIEARVGLAFMNAMTHVGNILDGSLVRFVLIFIIIVYAFWIMFEAYGMIKGAGDVKKLIREIIKKGALILIWMLVLQMGPAKIFMLVVGPVITIGTYVSDLILNTIANTAGANLPDTCAAVREYAALHTAPDMIMDAQMAADLMCVPTRLSGFFYTAVAAGLQWIIHGIGRSPFTVIAGLIFVVIFMINIWKFAIMALGVIANLFLAVFLLPFTAIAETIGKTTYKGIAGDIFNGFLGIFTTQSLTARITQFVNAAVYFVSLSIVVGVCAGILSGAVTTNLAASVPSIDSGGFIIVLLTGVLVAHLATRASDIAKDLGGSVDASLGTKFENDVKSLLARVYDTGKEWWKIIRDGEKKK